VGNCSEIPVLSCTWTYRNRNFNSGYRRTVPSCCRMVHDSRDCLLYGITYGAGILRHLNSRCSNTDWRSNVPDQLGTRNYRDCKIIVLVEKGPGQICPGFFILDEDVVVEFNELIS